MSNIAKTIPFNNDFLPAWSKVMKSLPLSRIHSKKQYDLMVKTMEYLADLVVDNSKHPLVGLLDILELLIENYDRIHNQIPPISGVERLKNIMIEHGLKQTDLQEIGSQGVVSEILSGKRRLNKRHAALLAKRFYLPEKFFWD